LYYFNPNFIGDFMTLTPAEGETQFGAFSHKIPYIVFFLFSIVMVVLAFVKKFSLIPLLGVMSCTYLMTELGIVNWIRFGIWLLVGLRIYRAFGYRNSLLNESKGSPPISLRLGTIVADFVFLFLILFPFVIGPAIKYIFDRDVLGDSEIAVFAVVAAVIAIALEILTAARERKQLIN